MQKHGNAVTTLPPSPSLEAAVEATTIDQCCFHNTDEDRGDSCSPFDCRPSYDNHHSTALSSLPSLALQSVVASQTTAQSSPATPDSLSLSTPNSQATATSQANLSSSAPPSRSSNVLIGLDHIFTSFLMKMEVLSVQNHHIQKQFGVIGSTKVKKDWTSSLTPPSSRSPPSTNLHGASSISSSTTAAYNSLQSPIEHFDVVDGLKPQHNTAVHFTNTHTTKSNHQEHQQYRHSFDMETATAASATPNGSIEASASAHYAYNNNLLYCAPNATNVTTTATAAAVAAASTLNNSAYHSPLTGIPIATLTPSPASSNLSTPTEATEHFGIAHDDDIDAAAVNDLSQRLQAELRAAKSRHLSCTEVSLPWDLTPRIAADMIKTSEREPCGVRGCAIFIDFEDETGSVRRIASFKVDPSTVSTFELFLTLKQDKGGWTSLLPQFLKNLTRSSTILISPHFTLNKHKLYACE
ncbi:hypothetical protein DOY81_007495 [Sarcophaga bullata]|nr:hypothetical protein DOY81_007495 [Sarcophaga bullata]